MSSINIGQEAGLLNIGQRNTIFKHISDLQSKDGFLIETVKYFYHNTNTDELIDIIETCRTELTARQLLPGSLSKQESQPPKINALKSVSFSEDEYEPGDNILSGPLSKSLSPRRLSILRNFGNDTSAFRGRSAMLLDFLGHDEEQVINSISSQPSGFFRMLHQKTNEPIFFRPQKTANNSLPVVILGKSPSDMSITDSVDSSLSRFSRKKEVTHRTARASLISVETSRKWLGCFNCFANTVRTVFIVLFVYTYSMNQMMYEYIYIYIYIYIHIYLYLYIYIYMCVCVCLIIW